MTIMCIGSHTGWYALPPLTWEKETQSHIPYNSAVQLAAHGPHVTSEGLIKDPHALGPVTTPLTGLASAATGVSRPLLPPVSISYCCPRGKASQGVTAGRVEPTHGQVHRH